MQGYARVYTDKTSQPSCIRHGTDTEKCTRSKSCEVRKESARRAGGESRLIELQKDLTKAGVSYTTDFGLDCVEVYWGEHPRNTNENDNDA